MGRAWALAARALLAACLILEALCLPSGVSGLEEGDACAHKRLGVPGVCKTLTDCPAAIEERKKDIDPQICGFRPSSLIPSVCCPGGGGGGSLVDRDTGGGGGGGVAARKCEEYVTYVRLRDDGSSDGECPKPPNSPTVQKLIVNGEPAYPKEFPHMALLGFGEANDIEYSCGGSLISPQYVLTAAHCITHRSRGWVRWVKLGELDRSTEQDDARPQLLEVRREDIIRHPKHGARAQYNDIALLRLNQTAALSAYVRPACLHTQTRVTPGSTAIVSGWGSLGYGEKSSPMLLKAGLTLVANDKCNETYGAEIRSPGSTIPQGIVEGQICAGSKTGKDSCQGDSGGPLQLFTPESPYCMYHVVGVVSFGKFCGTRYPGVYTRVAQYVPWIEQVVWPKG